MIIIGKVGRKCIGNNEKRDSPMETSGHINCVSVISVKFVNFVGSGGKFPTIGEIKRLKLFTPPIWRFHCSKARGPEEGEI